MNNTYCKKDISLTDQEIEMFNHYIDQQQLSSNIWDLFQEWIVLSNSKVHFFYLKVYQDDKLIGLGLFLKINSFDLRTSYSILRNNAIFKAITSVLSLFSRKCLYVCLRNLITANISRPFFFRKIEMEGVVMNAILSYLKQEKDADMVSIIDTKDNDSHYEIAGFHKFPCPSESCFDVKKYSNICEYLNKHKSLKKNISRKKNIIKPEIFAGPVSELDKDHIKACLDCSIENSRAYQPTQKFFEDNMFKTDVFNSDNYIHIVIRIDENIAGFHTFKVSGSNMGGVLGGFNRKYSRKNFVYERIIVASLDYAIRNGIKRVHYSLIDNFTKLRLVDTFEPCHLFFYSRNLMNRIIFKYAYKYSDIYKLYRLERQGLIKYKKSKNT